MIYEDKILVGMNDAGEYAGLIPSMANRHGLVAGATGTGKTVTLKVLAEAFSDIGVPVFLADVKGDVSGIAKAGTDTEDMQGRIARFGLADKGFQYQGYPVTLWDIYGKSGIPLRTTISEIGPVLMARILDLNDLQSGVLSVVFKIADDNNLLLIDTKDLKAILNYVDEHASELAADYGKISSATIGVIVRAIVSLESAGGDQFFGEPALDIRDWLSLGEGGKGMIHLLDSSSLVSSGRLYSAFLLWLISELFETLPEVGDQAKPKLVFFFDEAHLLFQGASKTLLEKIEQMVKLVRSKGVGIYFCTQNPRDIPDGVLSQLGNKIEHGLHAYTPADQKAVRAAAESFRVNEKFDTYETILALGTGEAVVSFLQEDGVPSVAEKVSILPPQCSFGAVTDEERDSLVKSSLLYSKYASAVDPDSAYEFLQRTTQSAAGAPDSEPASGENADDTDSNTSGSVDKAGSTAKKSASKAKKASASKSKSSGDDSEDSGERKLTKEEKEALQNRKKIANTVGGTVGREIGKTFGKTVGGSFGKTLGGNLGAQLGRNIMGTLFKK